MEQPDPISAAERSRRLRRITKITRQFGFVGRIEYRHVLSGSGGAQYGLGSSPSHDLLVVYAEAFNRDDDPEDFSLEAILAHECGHQVMCRTESLRQLVTGMGVSTAEEVLASLIGSLIVTSPTDSESLVLKALDDATSCGVGVRDAVDLIADLRQFLEKLL